MKRFLTLFPAAENIHLIKDVGMIPYTLHKEGLMQTQLACFNNGDYPYLRHEVAGLEIVFIKRRFKSDLLSILWFIVCYGRRFDILQMYHYDRKSLYSLLLFKILTAFRGKTYLKLDADHHVKQFRYVGFNGWIASKIMQTIDLVSVESKELHRFIQEHHLYRRPVAYIPNGFVPSAGRPPLLVDREPIILTVGRIGTFQKATEILVSAFCQATQGVTAWKLVLVGPVEPSFMDILANFKSRYPNLAPQIQLLGAVTDRNELRNIYHRARLFVLPSRYESFGFVCLEAIDAGCYLIASDLASLQDITKSGQTATLFPVADEHALVRALKQVMASDLDDLQVRVDLARTYIRQNFAWKQVCGKVSAYLTS